MFDIVIIGAGLSGLTAAYKILQKEPTLQLEILEASNTIGGQIAATPNGEVGGKWLISDQYHIYNLLMELRIPMRRRTPISKNLKRSWSLDEGLFAPIAKYELKRYLADLDLRSQLFRPGTYTLTADDREKTMSDHIRAKMWFESSRVFMMTLVRLVVGVDAKDVSYVEFMNVLHSCGGIKPLMYMYIESSPTLLEFSSEQLLGALESRLDSVVLKRLSKVTEIENHEDFVIVRESNGNIHSARTVVLAIPWNNIVDIFITPPVPTEMFMPYPLNKHYVTSFVTQYDEAHWRKKGLSGNFYCVEPCIFAQQYQSTSLLGIVLHDEGFELLAKSIILKTLAERFGEEMANPVEYYQQTFEQGALLNLPQTAPYNRIIWGSSTSATVYRGCMSGAVQSGLRAAVNALLILRPQNVNWQDLAEVQKANVVHQYPGIWELLKSSMNVYNTVFYTAVGLTVYSLLKARNTLF